MKVTNLYLIKKNKVKLILVVYFDCYRLHLFLKVPGETN